MTVMGQHKGLELFLRKSEKWAPLYALKLKICLKICTDWKHFTVRFKVFNKEIFPNCTNYKIHYKGNQNFAVCLKNDSNYV